MQPLFTTSYTEVLDNIEAIDPASYAKTRNYVDGSITYLSPYISRGVITLPQIVKSVLAKGYKPYQIEKFLQELAWREYFQRQWQQLGAGIFTDIRRPQQDVAHYRMVKALEDASTGIDAVNKLIENLYETGYMHNHARMYTAAIACNIARAHWLQPSRWLYYHLLDGDLASNACSWQWVAGTFSAKKYIASQENISRYLHSNQQKSYLNESYQTILDQPVPEPLKETSEPELITPLPVTDTAFQVEANKPLHIYTNYWLQPDWRMAAAANRVLLLEPSHFQQFPVNAKVLHFYLQIARENIPGIQVFVGEFADLQKQYGGDHIFSVDHPLHRHFTGTKDAYPWLFPQVEGSGQSFFNFWKRCEKYVPLEANPI